MQKITGRDKQTSKNLCSHIASENGHLLYEIHETVNPRGIIEKRLNDQTP